MWWTTAFAKRALSPHKGDRREAFVLDKRLSTVEWTNWWCKCFSRSSSESEGLPELARPAWGDEHITYEPQAVARILQKATGSPILSWQMGTLIIGEGEDATGISHGNHTGTVIKLCIAIDVLCCVHSKSEKLCDINHCQVSNFGTKLDTLHPWDYLQESGLSAGL